MSNIHELFVTPGSSLVPGSEALIAPISLWPFGTIASAHVLPALVDRDRFEAAISSLAALYPIIAGRLRKRKGKEVEEYYVAFTASPIKVVFETSDSKDPPFSTPAVIQPSLSTYVDNINPSITFDNDAAALVSFRVTEFPATNTSVLGISWSHILGDGNAFCTFTTALSNLYGGANVHDQQVPTFEPHASLFTPTEEQLAKWEIPELWPVYSLAEGGGKYYKAYMESEPVQVYFSAEEVKLLKSLAKGPGPDDWVSEQDGLSAYWVRIMELCGVHYDLACHSINYRHHFPNDPSFPPNLPTLVANVAQMHNISLPGPDSPLTISPVALAIRKGLETMKKDPEVAREWLSCRAHRLQQACDLGKMQSMVPEEEGHCVVNSNWRYDWNLPFGFEKGTTSFHTSFSTINFLRVFRANDSTSAECTWNVKKGLKDQVLAEINQDRADGWKRWSQSK